MTTNRPITSRRHPDPFREDTHMSMIGFRLAHILERQERARIEADHDRRWRSRSFRLRLGESIVRIGRRVGGESMTTPAWQG